MNIFLSSYKTNHFTYIDWFKRIHSQKRITYLIKSIYRVLGKVFKPFKG